MPPARVQIREMTVGKRGTGDSSQAEREDIRLTYLNSTQSERCDKSQLRCGE